MYDQLCVVLGIKMNLNIGSESKHGTIYTYQLYTCCYIKTKRHNKGDFVVGVNVTFSGALKGARYCPFKTNCSSGGPDC